MTDNDYTQPELALEAVPDLAAVAAEINTEHAAVGEAIKAGLSHAVRAGELLMQAKKLVQHGEWLPWLTVNCATISERTAQAYMRVARRCPELATKSATPVADLSFREAVKLLAEPTETKAGEPPEQFQPSSQFIPDPGCMLVGKQDAREAWIVPYSGGRFQIEAGERYFWVTVISRGIAGGSDVQGLSKPVRHDGIEACLRSLCFPLNGASWESFETPGADHNAWLTAESEADRLGRAIETLAGASFSSAVEVGAFIQEQDNCEEILSALGKTKHFVGEVLNELEMRKKAATKA